MKSWTYQGNTVPYDYDAAGNLKNPHGKTLTFNAANEVEGFTYDDAGNLLQDDRYQYTWDGEGRLLSVKDVNGNTIASFTYRPDGLRETKTVNGVTYHYHYDGSNLIRITDDNGQTVWAFTWANGKPNTVTNANGDTFYYVTNYRGDVVRIVDENGATVANYSYDPWGKVLSVSEDAAVAGQPLGYAGYYYDRETKLYYLQARYYDPETARLISRDPDPGDKDDPITQNAYTYANNNPVMNVDPDGHWAVDAMWLIMDTAAFASNPSLSGAAWIAADLASFADPTGVASTVAHAGRLGKASHMVYALVKGEEVVYVGRTTNAARREAAHKLVHKDARFQPVAKNLTYAQARGLEHRLYLKYGGKKKLRNRIRPISKRNKNYKYYMSVSRGLIK
ncbi:RHS repeat-associated protein [Anoxybacillus voinovskiensis]|uniref:RHS repeat-associated protein n=1 Tax=Anoxybacteroides voinovskiense TaxID=230470 RepID=A0A840DTD2_9BACL|nr:RHS repeat-associated core domain-containing protein [Anoxybacillus voinovskiensis]MBB4072799.1 RHS repeat-associated protein [Anoxybacillus voinovskiensis]GGJ65273.1 hypothetical protein GCM10008982_13220 [Anoxybacillus voinovskiensis]